MAFTTPLRKSMGRKSFIHSSVVTSSPLRRSTAGATDSSVVMQVPDDEAERSKRRSVVDMQRKLQNISAVASPLTEVGHILDENQIKDHLRICTKLFTENKITIKNAWELHVIDVIRKMLPTKTGNVLQFAGSSLDIGAKVYSYRVDDVHCKGLKLASHMARKKTDRENQEADAGPDADQTIGATNTKKSTTRKRKRLGGDKNTVCKDGKNLFAPPKMLEPVLFSTVENIDVSAADNLFTYKLPVNPSNQSIMLLTGEKHWITSDDLTLQTADEPIDIEFVDVSHTGLCEAFKDFDIGIWDLEAEENALGNNTILQSVVLDDNGLPMPELDGSLPNIFENDNDGPADSGSDVEEHQEEFQAQIHGEIAHIVDTIPEENRVETDYGYNTVVRTESGKFIDRIWAGPSHWKIKFVRRAPARFSGSTAQVVKHKRTKVQEKINFGMKPPDHPLGEVVVKRAPPTTTAEKITLPVPELMYEDFSTVLSHFLSKPGVPLPMRKGVNQHNGDYEVPVYNYDNPNDSQYCSQHNTDDNGADLDNHTFEEEEAPAACQNFLDDHLVDKPDMITASQVPYALQAKKMDMKKLKTAVWKMLTQDSTDTTEKEPVVHPMKFSQLYTELPHMLNKDMKKELSCPLAFVALLHLCNENNLKLDQSPSDCFKDFTIRKAT